MSLDRKFLKAQMFYEKEISDLEAKLAEKDKQLEKLKSENHALISDNAYKEADMFEFNSRIEQLQKQLAEKDQDKISFCIEQLETVLVLIHNAVNIDSPEYDLVGLYDAVSNQIKQVKEIK